MIASPNHEHEKTVSDSEQPAGVVVVDVGNSSLHLGVWTDQGLTNVQRVGLADLADFALSLAGLSANSHDATLVAVVVACVVPDVLDRVERAIEEALELRVLVVGRDIPLPLEVALDHPESVGVDRVCAAAAAYDKVRGQCAVIDFGTAATVDLVDDSGVFQGGAILPGVRLQALALGNHAAALPVVSAKFPKQPVGKDTTEAICSGICHGIAGAVRNLVEQFATGLNQWPYVVATGGDVEMMMDHCDFIDACVADLCLHGIGVAYVKHLDTQTNDDA